MKKILLSCLTILALVMTSHVSASSHDDFTTVLNWMYDNGLTKYETVDAFRPDDAITRGEAAKFVDQYAQFMNIDKTHVECYFTDLEGYDYTLIPHIAEACSYGLLKGSQGNFMPYDNLTEAQGMTIAMRSLYGSQDESMTPWYKVYYDLAAKVNITTTTTPNALDGTILTRAQLGTWFYQAAHVGQDGEMTDGIKAEQGKEVKSTKISGYLDYSPSKVAQALAQGQHVVLFFHASRCPSCQLLHTALTNQNPFPSTLAVFKIDYDTATELKTTYSITKQHTLIKLDKNEQETKRNTTATTFNALWKELVEGPGI